MKKIRALIVDDEPIARKGIRRELEGKPGIAIIAECANGYDAVMAIQKQQPDLVFLDLQMPELDGFGVVEAVGVKQMPTVIFVTAYDEFALRAFEIHALDYILKPFNSERFQQALEHARRRIEQANFDGVSQKLKSLIEDAGRQPPASQSYLERIVVKSGGKIFFINTEAIDWIEAADNYVRLHVGNASHLVQGTMNRLESKLNPEVFLRIHRSTIVNLRRVKELQPLFHGEYVITLASGKTLTSSRSYRDKLQRLVANAF
ncbi:MAG: LytTR family DNA-binding domain-containing protein [Acidobacteriota bacterium]